MTASDSSWAAEEVQGVPLDVLRTDPRPCAYLPGRTARNLVLLTPFADGRMYQSLMDAGYRRTGQWFYRPDCAGCCECTPIRVPVDRFAPSRSQRRLLRRNADVQLQIGPPSADDEHFQLYCAYQTARHGDDAPCDRSEFVESFCQSPIESIEISYRLDAALIGVGIVDVCAASLSSVYFYFDPAHSSRSLGTWSGLCEIEECRRRGLPYWYLGFHVRGCAKMEYKSRFRPYELLGADGRWREPSEARVHSPSAG